MDEINSSKFIAFPRGFIPLTLVLALGMAGFILVQGILSLYCAEVFGLSDQQAHLTSITFVTIIFTVPILGGFIAEKLLGYVTAAILSLFLAIAGLFNLCFQSLIHLYLGLALFSIGNSIAIACIYVILGRRLNECPHKRIAGFTIVYTCMNVGALVAMLSCTWMIRNWGYQSIFMSSTILFIAAAFIFLLNIRSITPAPLATQSYDLFHRLTGITIIFFTIPAIMLLLHHPNYDWLLLTLASIIAAVTILHCWMRYNSHQRRQLQTFLVVSLFAVFFWMLYALEPTVLTLFVERNVDRNLGALSIPSSDFFSFNPLFIVVVGCAFSMLWLSLSKRQRKPSIPYKFALGIGCVGGAYLLLSASTYFSDQNGLIGIEWIIVSYILLSAAELLISPIGIAMVGMLTSPQDEGSMMGVWLFSSGLGSTVEILLTHITALPDQSTNPLITDNFYSFRFCEFGLIGLFLAVVLSLCAPRLLKQTAPIRNQLEHQL